MKMCRYRRRSACQCEHYSDGALPEGIAAVVMAAVACRDGDGCSDDGDAELLESVDALTDAELAMAGVTEVERG